MPSRVTPAEIAIRLEPLAYRDKLALAERLLGRMTHFSADAAEALVSALEPACEADHAALREWLADLSSSAAARYVQARIASDRRDFDLAASLWSEFFAVAPCDDPFVHLHFARTLSRLGRWNDAAAALRTALHLDPPYSLFTRAEKLIDQIRHEAPAAARQARIAILGSSTTALLVPVLRAVLYRDGIDAEVYEGLYGAFRQEMLDPDSGLARFNPDIVVVATHWRDLNLPPVSDDEPALIDRLVGEYAALWKTASDRLGCHVVQHGFDLPAAESFDVLSPRVPGGRARVIRSINLRFQSEAPPFVSILDVDRVVSTVGIAAWEQPGLWQVARQHPATDALPALAHEQAAHIRAVLGLTRKVLVCDLDNTLWGGVIGEDGLDGIRIGGTSEGECFLELQRYIRELQERGVLLAVCSKNNPEDARLPFERHPRMLLRVDDFAAFVANWDDKATNIRRIAEQLRLGLDSFVVLDDNPLERAWIRRELPQVAVVDLGRSPSTYVRALDRERHFASLTWSREDRARTEQYRRGAAIESARAAAGSVDAFLEGLHMRGAAAAVTPANLARVVQLTNKTNQFNLTTRRYTQPQVEQIAATPGAWTGVFSLADRFGDHGIVGLLFAVPASEPATWTIDTWLMSCRVLGRQFEAFMADRLVDAARAHGISRIVGVYRPTPKNSLVEDLLPRLGFVALEDGGREDKKYVLHVADVQRPYTRFVANQSEAAPLAPAVR